MGSEIWREVMGAPGPGSRITIIYKLVIPGTWRVGIAIFLASGRPVIPARGQRVENAPGPKATSRVPRFVLTRNNKFPRGGGAG